MDLLRKFQKRQEGALQRKMSGGLLCRSWAAEWFVLSPEYLVSFASRTSAKVKVCVSLAAITAVEAEEKADFCISYALQLGKAACDKVQKLFLRAIDDDEMQRWISAINEAQEQRRRDRYFLPLSVAEEIIAEQRQLTEEEAAESKRQKAATSTIRRELACVRIAAALSSISADCLSAGLLQLRSWKDQVQYQKDQEAAAEAEAAAAEAAAAETQRLEILERFASSLCCALQRSMIVGLSHLGVSSRCCYRSALLCRAIQRGQSARAAARHQALAKTLQMLKMPRTCEAHVQTDLHLEVEWPGNGSAEAPAPRSAPAHAAKVEQQDNDDNDLLQELGLPSDSESSDSRSKDASAALASGTNQAEQGEQVEQVTRLEGHMQDAAASAMKVRTRLTMLQEHLDKLQASETARQEDEQYAQRWMLEVVACEADSTPHAVLQPSAFTGSTYDHFHQESSSDLDFKFSDCEADGSAVRTSKAVQRLPSKAMQNQQRPPPPPRNLPVGTPSQRALSSETETSPSSRGRGEAKSSSSLAPLPPCPLQR